MNMYRIETSWQLASNKFEIILFQMLNTWRSYSIPHCKHAIVLIIPDVYSGILLLINSYQILICQKQHWFMFWFTTYFFVLVNIHQSNHFMFNICSLKFGMPKHPAMQVMILETDLLNFHTWWKCLLFLDGSEMNYEQYMGIY